MPSNSIIHIFSNEIGVGGNSDINTAICPAGFAQFIDVCTILTVNAATDFAGT